MKTPNPLSIRSLLALILVILPCVSASAEEIAPFATRNQSPLVAIFGLPAAEDGLIAENDRLLGRLTLDVANNFTGSDTAREFVHLDGESYRLNLALRYGLTQRFEIGADIPWVGHYGGGFDGFIENWHNFFGLSQGGREDFSRNEIDYIYARDGRDPISVTDENEGVGDISLTAAYQLYRTPDAKRALALRAGLKLPTGDDDDLRGSGSTDFSLHVTGRDSASLAHLDITLFGGGGVLVMTEGDVLPDQQNNLVGFASAGFGWQPLGRIALKLQIDAHTSFYDDSALREIDSASAQIVMGGSLFLPAAFTLDLAVIEDIVVDTAPDVVFHAALSRTF